MISDAASAGLAGFNAAARRLETSAHNVANLGTRDFRPLEVRQAVDSSERPQVVVERSQDARPVEIAGEMIEQIRARVGAQASLRVIEADVELKGMLVDLEA